MTADRNKIKINPNYSRTLTMGTQASGWEFVTTTINNPVEIRLTKIEKLLEKINDRLAIIDETNSTDLDNKLHKFATLRDAYDKYKFIEGLCDEKENKTNE